MTLRTAAHRSFLLLNAGDTARRLEQLQREIDFTHVIVRRQDAHGTLYYLISRRTLLRVRLDTQEPLAQALALPELQAVETVSWDRPVSEAPESCIVLDDDGQVVGFLSPDLRHLGPTRSVRGGGTVSGSLRARFQESMTVNETASLLITLTPELVYAFDALQLQLPHGAEVDVVVEVEEGLERVGRREATLIFDTEQESPAEQFKIRATAAGTSRVSIYAFHQGQALGKLRILVTVQAEGDQVRSGGRSTSTSMRQFRDLHPRLLSVDLAGARTQAPDVDLIIRHTQDGSKRGWVRTLHSERFQYHYEDPQPLWLDRDPAEYLRSLLTDLEDLQSPSQERLRTFGFELTRQLLPGEIQNFLWQHREEIRTLHIQSDEPWIPWEICSLRSPRDTGKVDLFGMLCEHFEVTRWLLGAETPRLSRWRRGVLIVPADSGLERAAQTSAKSLGLEEHLDWEPISPVTQDRVITALASGRFQLIHYSGHAVAYQYHPHRCALQLESGEQFTPVELNGTASALAESQPLVFLNGCETGQGGLALTRDTGFAERFLEAGAAAFVGTRWSVSDEEADTFARAFYQALADGDPLGKAMKRARNVSAEQGGTAWLAYMLLAQPDAPPPLPKAKQLVYR